jgi:uncharacterized protein YceK
MSKAIKILKLLLLIIIIVVFSGCASANKNTYFKKRKQSSRVSMSQMGKNKYYFSSGYQKKLNKNYKKK